MRKKNIYIVSISTLVPITLIGMSFRAVYTTYEDPNGNYIVRITYKKYLEFIGSSPGSSSDKPGYVEILDKTSGKSMGEIPVEMISLAEIKWVKNGAGIKLVGGWDFKKETCFYWDYDTGEKVVMR